MGFKHYRQVLYKLSCILRTFQNFIRDRIEGKKERLVLWEEEEREESLGETCREKRDSEMPKMLLPLCL